MRKSSLSTAVVAGLSNVADLSACACEPDALGQVLIYPYYTVQPGPSLVPAHDEMIEQDEYLRKLRNSSAGLCGLSFQGHGASEVLSIWEIRALLRMELDRLAARGEKGVQDD